MLQIRGLSFFKLNVGLNITFAVDVGGCSAI